MIVFSPARRVGKRAFAQIPEPLTPNAYVTLRRKAAGLSRLELARRLTAVVIVDWDIIARQPVAATMADAIALVDRLEMPRTTARHRVTIEALAKVMPIDVDVYFQLATEPADRHPYVCRRCGCADGLPTPICPACCGVSPARGMGDA